MKTEYSSTFLGKLLDKIHPSDLLHKEHRLALRSRIEHMLEETGLDRLQFGSRVRTELQELRSWLSGTRDLTIETLSEICGILHISLGDLVTE